MKRQFLFLLFLLLTTLLSTAQEIVTEFWHENGKYFNFHNIMEADDGTLILQGPVYETSNGPEIGWFFYKITTEGELLDSLLMPVVATPFTTLLEPLPDKSGEILFARFEKNLSDSTTYLIMTTLDRNLNITNDTCVAIEFILSGLITGSSDLFIDPYGDIIASYKFTDRVHMLRVGLDGTIKYRAAIANIPFANEDFVMRHTGVYGAPQLRYCLWGYVENAYNVGIPTIYVVDSLFNVVDFHQYNKIGNELWLVDGLQHHAVPFDNAYNLYGTMAHGRIGSQINDVAALVKFDNEFNIEKIHLAPVDGQYYQPTPIWTSVASPDTIYYSYMNHVGGPNRIVVSCLDADLNVRWTRYCLEPDMFHWATCMAVLHGGRVAVGSFKYYEDNQGGISVVIIKDELWNIPENQDYIRPYAYYPNPAQDELHLQYSPDVKPTQIELFDIQGRLMRLQRNGLERLNLQGLPAGTYTMRVTLEGGKVFSDKVIKE